MTTNEAVLVTGASSGIGLEIAIQLAESGFHVYASMRDLTKRGVLDAEARRRNVQLDVLQLDVTDQQSIEQAVQTIVTQSGGIYGLVNNAGSVVFGYFEDISDAEMRQIFETNVFGAMTVTRAVLPYMRAARRGRIILVSSITARMGVVALNAYSSTKCALEGFGEALALEIAPFGIKVSMIEPTVARTSFWNTGSVAAKGAHNPASPYYQLTQTVERIFSRFVSSAAITSSDVARSVVHAFETTNPRLRYVVGRVAQLVFVLRRYLPCELFDRLYQSRVNYLLLRRRRRLN